MKAHRMIVLALAFQLAHAQDSADRQQVNDIRVLMIAAIDSVNGEARGVMAGPDAAAITQHFKASGPILVDVTTERRFRQPGCSRLKVSLTQEGLQLPGSATPQRRTVDFGLNYCRDGTPPRSLS
jgi:hypothetical protein